MEILLGLLLAGSTLLLVYPFVLYPLLLACLPRHDPPAARLRPDTPRCALLIAARNEAAELPELLRRLRSLRRAWPELRITIWNDASTDHTGRLLDTAGGGIAVRHARQPVGKAAALRAMIDGEEADLLFLMDANIRFCPGDLLALRRYLDDPGIGAAAARLVQDGAGNSRIGRFYRGLEDRIRLLETATGSTMGCDGALWAIRRALYPRFALAEADDFRPSMEALLAGRRVVMAEDVHVRELAPPDRRGFARAFRIGCGAWHAHRSIWPRIGRLSRLDRFKYVSHKLVRWFAGLWLVLALAAALGLAVVAGWGAMAAGVLGVAAVLGAAGVFPFSAPWGIGVQMLGTTLGVLHAMRGRALHRWTPVRAR
ncbi:glycosyltransferase [Halovulum dunhuangense]|uniref:Glycosyltransferase n=1 Tax=Halovulum dunhuangense TaxID=1505036 RepID=A0A849KZG2_9RHOB|nr:glycosyltransferase [Halovulum dunhuangense]NNU79064.1 glycosyltransferase [Halovulum dunhuangense]